MTEHYEAQPGPPALAYWRKILAQLPAPIELPEDFPRPERAEAKFSRETVSLDTRETERVRHFVRDHGATVGSTLLASFGVLLHRLSGARDFVTGVATARQEVCGASSILLLPVRQSTEPAGPFAHHVAKVSAAMAEAFEQASVPGSELRRLFADAAHTSPFRVAFSPESMPGPADSEEATQECSHGPSRTIDADLSLTILDRPESLGFACDYSAARFTPATIRRWLGHLRTLLGTAVVRPETTLENLPLLTLDEVDELVAMNSGTTVEPVAFRPLHALFEDQFDADPNAPALQDADRTITYGELEARANRLAGRLLELGAGPEQRVVLLYPRSVEFVVAVLAVLKTGAAFVPLDAGWPRERQAQVTRDSGASLLVTGGLPPPDAAPIQLHVLDTEAEGAALASRPDLRPATEIRPENLAYVIYTSGSTGRPKGVMIEHGAISTHIKSVTRHYGLGPDDRGLFFHSTAFDPIVEQLFSAFHAGASVYIRGQELWTGGEFLDVVNSSGLTIVDLPPRYLQQLLQEIKALDTAADFGRLRIVIVGGETLPLAAVRLWRELGLSRLRLINSYGPTECSVIATCYDLPPEPCRRERLGRVPIGRTHGPVRAYVLDPALRLVPIGAKGELCLGGPTVGRGYLGQEKLTAERFLPDPFCPGGRIYRTGDQARLLPDGNIEYLGRFDRQVQVRGYRVELAEIESQIAQHPQVDNAAVVALEDADGTGAILAYFQPAPGCLVAPEALRRHLASRLPDYMIPNHWSELDQLPTDPNGKIDYRKLPRLDLRNVRPARPVALPASAAEETLLDIWQRSLGREAISTDDDFFALGGHSLMAIRMLAEINQAFGAALPMARLFEAPTIQGLAASLAAPPSHLEKGRTTSSLQDSRAWKFLLPLHPHGSRPPLFICAGGHGSEEEFVVMARLSRLLNDDQPVFGLRVGGHDRLEPMHKGPKDMAADVFAEIQRFQPEGPYHILGECAGGLLAAALAHRAESLGAQVRFLGLLDTAAPRFAEPLLAWIESHWITRLARRAWFHFSQLGQLPLTEIPGYIRDRGKWAQTHVQNGVSPPNTGLMPDDPVAYHYYRVLIRDKPGPVRARITALISEEFARTGQVQAWRNLSSRGLTVVPLVGTHYSYIRSDVTENAARIKACLEAIRPEDDHTHAWKIPLAAAKAKRGRHESRRPSPPHAPAGPG